MMNLMIRKLIQCGFTPEGASDICLAYVKNLTLSDLEVDISLMEANHVDQMESKPNRQECGGLLRESDFQGSGH